MKQLGFEEAIRIIDEDKYAQFEKVTTTKHIVLSPKYLGRVKTGIVEQLNSELNFASESLDGILIAYSSIHLLQRLGRILDDQPYIHFNIQADFVVFKPVIGCLLRGVVNKVSKNHIGCLVHNCFNASLARPAQAGKRWQGDDLVIGDEFVFQVIHVHSHNKFLSIKGKFTDEGILETSGKKRTRDDIDQITEAGDVVDMATVGSHGKEEENITDSVKAKSKSKKKKRRKNPDEGENQVEEGMDVNPTETGETPDTQDDHSSRRKHKKKKAKKERPDPTIQNGIGENDHLAKSPDTSLLFNEEIMATEKQNFSLDISGVHFLDHSPIDSSTCKKKKKDKKKSRKWGQDPDKLCEDGEESSKGNILPGNRLTDQVELPAQKGTDDGQQNSPLLFSSQEEPFTFNNKKHKKSKKHKKGKGVD
ncbi:DNA-directed RNA polymerase I subunit RPA43-like [Mizuhopecten yessoensis]|uniref:DNA-directed RNA polymerase I subunit RPA43 n=1 Tax=Mizuhopecten yessoensis TaxID=6573 RepID=A0A210Q2G3_MIZYE|nr:DNA-directed RNA polymerase I subunit RPA43-like [Mizuhopecten yessoensis]OWF42943.1 DNA-directed RNA polymerase I subunit RPA43 [Mizuhopecten yessoensis]